MAEEVVVRLDTTAWHGDWQSRIRSRIEERGYRDLLDYLKSIPGETLPLCSHQVGTRRSCNAGHPHDL